MNTDLENKRKLALSRIISYHTYRHQDPERTKIRYFQRILDQVIYYRGCASRMSEDKIKLLRELESGLILDDSDEKNKGISGYANLTNDNKIILSDTGRAFLYAIDCNFEQLELEIKSLS